MSKVAVFGAGSWGTAFSIVLADAGNEVTIWGRREEVCATINERHQNTDYLSGIELPRTVSATHDPEEAAADAEAVFLVVPSQTFRENLEEWADALPPRVPLVSLMKGVELGSLKRMSEVIEEVTGAGPERVAVVSGPNLSAEIARREPAASVVACAHEEVAKRLQAMCHSPAFRPYTSVDVLGDRCVDPGSLGQGEEGGARLRTLGDLTGARVDLLGGHPLAEVLAEGAVARQR
jgi:glycerol-3-phosphate dehydrogenase (NAD(P)+)